MSELKTLPEFTSLNRTANRLTKATLFEGLANAFGAQADFLQRMEDHIADFLRHRRADCVAAQSLFDRLHAANSASDVLQAQQDWIFESSRRALADVLSWPSIGFGLLGQNSDQPSSDTPAASTHEPRSHLTAKAAE